MTKRRILLAEDDSFTREGLTDLLEAEGYEVTAARDGSDAWRRFQLMNPDLVLLDLMMPGLSGYEVLRKIRKDHPRLPVLLLSAKSEEFDKVLGLDLGADDFITKPFGAQELLARLRRTLDRSVNLPAAPLPEGPFAFGPWEIRPQELRAWQAERAVDLSPREVKLLALMAGRKGQAIPRALFFQIGWDLAEPPNSRTLDQHIAQLRKKLEVEPGRPQWIHTVQGVGYRHP